MMQKKASEKKDSNVQKLHIEMQARSNSQCADTINLMKEQQKQIVSTGVFAQPFKVQKKASVVQSSSDPVTISSQMVYG